MIGDAAHAIPPSVGQGGAMALEDAQTLAIALARSDATSLHSLLLRWERHRQHRIERVTKLTEAGSDLRKSLTELDGMAGKEERLKQHQDALGWLYGYDGTLRDWVRCGRH